MFDGISEHRARHVVVAALRQPGRDEAPARSRPSAAVDEDEGRYYPSCLPSGVRSMNCVEELRSSTPRAYVEYVWKIFSPSRMKTL